MFFGDCGGLLQALQIFGKITVGWYASFNVQTFLLSRLQKTYTSMYYENNNIYSYIKKTQLSLRTILSNNKLEL